jgi:hemolysin III
MIKKHIEKMPVEEVANTLTHGFGLLLSFIGLIILVTLASYKNDVWYYASAIIYGLSMVCLYAAFTLIALNGTFGNTLFIIVWVFALIGILIKIFLHKRIPAASVVSYLVMGWIAIFAVQPLYNILGFTPLAWIVAGGLIYTLGTIFYGWKSIKHHHAIWHIFVLSGSICHFIAVAFYIIPLKIL